MPRRARTASNSGYYHVVMRGIGKQILFEEKADYLRFLETLERYLSEEPFDVLAYCLMENHVHLLLHTQFGLERIMKRIAGSYAYYFNSKYERSGHLFQDRFSSEPIDSDSYLLAVVRYIHNNPQKAGICARENYPWSSWQAYMGKAGFVSTRLILEMTNGQERFRVFSAGAEEVECLDISESKRISDNEALRIIKEELHLTSGTELQSMERRKRDDILKALKTRGLSVRQIERLTGINRGVIYNA